MAAETKPDRSVTLPCPRCSEAEAGMAVRLNLLGEDDDTFQCLECDAEFGVKELDEIMAKWNKVTAWVKTFPGDMP